MTGSVNVIQVESEESEFKAFRTTEASANAIRRIRTHEKDDTVSQERVDVTKEDLVEEYGEEKAERTWRYWTEQLDLEVRSE